MVVFPGSGVWARVYSNLGRQKFRIDGNDHRRRTMHTEKRQKHVW